MAVKALVTANLLAADSDLAVGRTLNIATGTSTTIAALIANLCELLGVDADPVFGPPRPGDVHESTADIAVARELLGYSPDVDLTTGLRLTTAWISDRAPGEPQSAAR